MRIITISREFGSGGRELGKRLAEALGYDYYDREIVEAIAANKGLDEEFIEKSLETNTWQSAPLTLRHSFHNPVMMQDVQTSLLIEQRKVLEGIAKQGKNCVIVGRNADVILEKENPCSIFVCANLDAKVLRCMERAEEGENLTRKQIVQNIKRIDKNRARTREMITGAKWGDAKAYHLTVNTTGWNIKDLVPAIASFVNCWFENLK